MMTEEQLIAKLKELRQIKPRENWVLLAKKEILVNDKRSLAPFEGAKLLLQFPFQYKPIFAGLVVLVVLIGVFGFAQNSLPGDSLYSIKKIAEKSQAVFFSEKGQIIHNFDLANRRLDDLTKVVEQNSVRNLGPAINEFQASISKAAESLVKTKDPKVAKEIALEIKKLEEKTEQVKSLGVEIGESEELENALTEVVEREIKDLETRTLTEEQAEILIQAKSDFETGNYSQALEKVLILSNPQP